MRPLPAPALLSALFVLALPGSGSAAEAQGAIVEHLDHSYVQSDGYVALMDVRHPVVPPGPTGWPLVVYVHGAGGSKNEMADDARFTASRGYATMAYDVRGQGPSMALNDRNVYGFEMYGLRERLDLFEAMEAAEAAFPAEIDFDRIAVTGGSQGATMAWAAAAHGGLAPPPNPWRSAAFPQVAAIAPRNFPPDHYLHLVPEHKSMSHKATTLFFSSQSGIHFQPQLFQAVAALVLAEDFAGAVALLDDPSLDLEVLLQTSTVPTRATMAYDDDFGPPNRLAEVWDTLLPNAPRLLNLTTGGHGSASNSHEWDLRDARLQSWLDRYLKGIPNGVEDLSEYRVSVAPEDSSTFADADSLWDFREMDVWPDPNTQSQTWFLQPGGGLETLPPTTGASGTLLQHSVPPTFGMLQYAQLLPVPEDLLQIIPLNTILFESAPLASDQLLLGAGEADLWVSCPTTRFQLHVVVYDVFPNGEERYVTGGFTTIRDDVSAGVNRIRFPLNLYSYAFRKDHRIRIDIENLVWHRPPDGSDYTTLHALPVFESFDATILHDPAQPSSVSLPLVPFGPPTLVASQVALRRSALFDTSFSIRSDSSRAGWNYQFLAGISGTSPGFSYAGVPVPLNVDAVTRAIIQGPPGLPANDLRGQLDALGCASPAARLSLVGGLPLGMEALSCVALIQEPSGAVTDVTQALVLPVVP